MRLENVRIKNFRAFADVEVPLNGYTCLVGPNGAGKSTIIAALKVFFHEPVSEGGAGVLTAEDFHQRRTEEPVEITLTFTDLSDQAKEDLKHYVRAGKLIVTVRAEWNEDAEAAQVHQYGNRLVMPGFKPFFAAVKDNERVPRLREIYREIREGTPELPNATTKGAMEEALREYEEQHPDLCEESESGDQFYGVSKGSNLLGAHIQWVHVPAVKDAGDEDTEGRNTWLGQLLLRAVRSRVDFEEVLSGIRKDTQDKYNAMLEEQQGTLSELSSSLTTRMRKWSHPGATLGLRWAQDPSKAIRVAEPLARIHAGDGAFEGSLARQGHGFQRSYLLALLQELASGEDGQGPALLLGVEEPELYQHPPQARHLSHVLQELSDGNSQIVVCTHSPYFISGRGFADVRMCRKRGENGSCMVAAATYEEVEEPLARALGREPRKTDVVRARLDQALQPAESELFFSPFVVLVEGIEDVAYLAAHAHTQGRDSDLRRRGCHFLPANGKSRMLDLLAVCKALEIPAMAVFDADGDVGNEDRRKKHERDNRALMNLLGHPEVDTFPTETVWRENMVVWPTNIASVLTEDYGEDDFRAAKDAVRAEENLHDKDIHKNPLFIGHVVKRLSTNGKSSTVLANLLATALPEHDERAPDAGGPPRA